MRILLVDDEPAFTNSVRRNLEREGWGVITARSGPEALALLDAGPELEILATDYNMPGMDGAQLVNQALAIRPELYTIVFTGWEDRSYAVRSLRVGADDFIDKEQDFGAKLQQAIRRGFQQVAIERMGRQLLQAGHEREVLDMAFGTLRGLGRFDGFCLAARGWASESCRIERAMDLRTGVEVEAREELAEDSAYRYVIEKWKAYYPPMLEVADKPLQPYLRDARSIIVVPVFVHACERGALGIEHLEADKFKIDDLRFLRQVAQWISLAMEKIANQRRADLERKRTEQNEGLLARTLLHEIKNPLNNLAILAQEEASIEGQDLEDLKANVSRISRVLESFLRKWERASPSGEWGSVALGEALDEAVSRFQIYNPKSGVLIEYEAIPALPSIRGIREMLVAAFVNLLQNGAAAAGSTGRLSIRAHFVPLREEVEILFSDNGPGIPAGDLDRIFDYGFTTGGEEHFGHGLALTQEVVQLHGGDITVESGRAGATFKVVLPLKPLKQAGVTEAEDTGRAAEA
jgi:signal transduction histidine kinase